MKIGLVAHRYHAGVLQMYVELCAAAGLDVVLYTSEPIHRQLRQFAGDQPVRASRVVLDTGMGQADYLRLVAGESGQLDALLFVELQFDTPAVWRDFPGMAFRCPVYAGVHDIVMEPGLEPLPPWRVRARAEARLRAEAFRTKIDGFLVHSEQMKAWFERQAAPRKVCFVPVYFRDRRFRRVPRPAGGPLRCCITGAYSETLKEYHRAVEAFGRAADRGAEATLTLAGRPLWAERAEFIAFLGYFDARRPARLRWWTEYMDESLFSSVLEETDVLLAPVVRRPPPPAYWLPGGPSRRIYHPGTRITAGTYDAIRFQLPIIYPAHYMPDAAKHPGSLTYRSWDELADLLVDLAADRARLAALTDDMIRYAAGFTPERFVAPFRDLLGQG